MRSTLRYLFALALAAMIPALSGCGTFFIYPGTSTSGGSTTTSYAYFANSTTNTVSGYALASGTPVAVTGSPYSLSASPNTLVVTPANTFLYVGSSLGALYGYSINTTTGQLTALSSGQALASVTAVSMDVSPDGKWLLVLDNAGVAVDEYAINISTGALTPATGATYPIQGNGASSPHAIRFAPSATLVFAALGTGGDAIFNFNTSTGALTYYAGLTGSATSSDNALAVDSTSSHLYVARSGDGTGINAYTVAASGALTGITGAPFATGSGPYDVVIDKTGAFLYAANRTDGTISGFTIATTGALTTISGSPFASGSFVTSLGRDSLGKYIVAASQGGSSDLTMYTFDTTTLGKLDISKTSTTGTDPTGAIAVAMTH